MKQLMTNQLMKWWKWLERQNQTLVIVLMLGLSLVLVVAGWMVWKQKSLNNSQGGVKVAATIFPLYDIVRNVAGNEVETVLVLPPGSSPHTYESAPSDVEKMVGSRVVFAIGHGLDDWASKLAESAGVKKMAIVDRDIQLLGSSDPKVGVADPHYWLTVPNAMLISKTVADELAITFPDKAKIFMKNQNDYAIKLAKFDLEMRKELMAIPNMNLAVFHGAWNYFAKEYGLTVVATFEEFAGKSPTPEELKQFSKNIKDAKVTTIFTEPQFSPMEVEPIAKDLGVGISLLDPEGGVAGRGSFIELMQFNVGQIINASK